MKKFTAPLVEAMVKYLQKDIARFDVPGHKRGKGISNDLVNLLGRKAVEADINSLPELDNLNHPTGVIKEAQELMAEAYRADNAFFMVNGTSSAVHAMLLAACDPGEKILLPRNVHKSVINGIIMSGAIPVFMQPEIDQNLGFATGITFETAKSAIDRNPDAKAILLLNPTYYGVCSDLKAIASYAHANDIIVVVDEAHGAHFAFNDQLPVSSMDAGADLAAVSIHKTGGSLTQSSVVLHQGDRVPVYRLQAMINLIATTSASYLLMASLDAARKNLVVNGRRMLNKAISLARHAREEINSIPGFYAFGRELIGNPGVYDFDETKLGINVSQLGITGCEIYDMLRLQYDIQPELSDVHNVLAVISLGDYEYNVERLIKAFRNISRKTVNLRSITYDHIPCENPEAVMTPREAFYSDKFFVPLEKARGYVIAESIMAYPPGIPILSPGERITGDHINYLKYLKTQKTKLTDMNDPTLENVLVVKTAASIKEVS